MVRSASMAVAVVAWLAGVAMAQPEPGPAPAPAPGAEAALQAAYKGCYKDNSVRALQGAAYTGRNDMTVELCNNLCQGYQYFGVEVGNQCYCGVEYERYGLCSTAGNCVCDKPCSGDGSQSCGGTYAMNVYETQQDYPISYVGCYKDASDRAMPDRQSSGDNSVERCNSACQGSPFFSLQSAGTCYCGTEAQYSRYGKCSASNCQCNQGCRHNSVIRCGGSWAMSVYETRDQAAVLTGEPINFNTKHSVQKAGTSTNLYLQGTRNCNTKAGFQQCPGTGVGQYGNGATIEYVTSAVNAFGFQPAVAAADTSTTTSCVEAGSLVKMYIQWSGTAPNAWLIQDCGTPQPLCGGTAIGLTDRASDASTFLVQGYVQGGGLVSKGCLTEDHEFVLFTQDGTLALSDCGQLTASNCNSGFSLIDADCLEPTRFTLTRGTQAQSYLADTLLWVGLTDEHGDVQPLALAAAAAAAVGVAAVAWARRRRQLGGEYKPLVDHV